MSLSRKLGRTMYGLQDAGSAFDHMSGDRVAKRLGFKLRTFSLCVLNRGNFVAQRYEDDYPVLGTRGEVREFREDMSKHLRTYC